MQHSAEREASIQDFYEYSWFHRTWQHHFRDTRCYGHDCLDVTSEVQATVS